MKIQFETDFTIRHVFQPVYTLSGRLLALEIQSRFNSPDGALAMPAEIGVNLLQPAQKAALFYEQLGVIEAYADWFIEHQVLLSINIDATLAALLLQDNQLCQRLRRQPFIVVEISESFPQLSAGKNNATVRRLSELFTLWLDDFGSGQATLTPLYDGLFTYVKIDKRFYWRLFSHPGSDTVMDSLLRNINLLCQGIIVGGIEKKAYFNHLDRAGVLGLQGFLWPAVGGEQLDTLCKVPPEFIDADAPDNH
ncbi:diguanylate phosphodiesterase [Serratia sp. MYb239]|uniref:EAL domain-containing protein n=1 Tax=Serratia sp. MYb239 TaxID=2033438 RepID=UPI000CF632A0|nr:EAL domain-containing protein [Serratia sp. MYb239]AVJ17429.1 diguanylate phosphodiesterase [Serratia sp. MYb239]MCA4822144.1 EAL domain-containing protein [Serratia rubidaea]QPT15431.1 EAL domain-containing protein [Serratia rubidaea]